MYVSDVVREFLEHLQHERRLSPNTFLLIAETSCNCEFLDDAEIKALEN